MGRLKALLSAELNAFGYPANGATSATISRVMLGPGTISQYGARGMREHAGQPIVEAPKYRAVLEAAAQ
jgi:hypothetical protein